MSARDLVAALAGALVLTPLALPCTATADWPTYGHDLANSRAAGTDGPAPDQASSLAQAWAFQSSNGDFTGTPVVADGTLVAGTNLGTVYALDAVTGKLRWSRDTGQNINGTAAIDPDAPGGATVFVPVAQPGSPHLLALSLDTGKPRWDTVLSTEPRAFVYGSPTYWRNTVYIGTSGTEFDESNGARGSVLALDEATGKTRWQTYTVPPGHDGGAVWSTPAIDAATGRLYVGTGNAYDAPAADTTDSMLAISAATGEILQHFQATASDVWELEDPAAGPDWDFGASPNLIAGPGGRALVGEGQKSGIYWALDRATMRPVWRTTVGPGSQADGGVNSTAYDGKRIYGSESTSSEVFALGADGKTQWSSPDTGAFHFTPVATGDGVVYSVDPDGFLTARDAESGAILTKLALNTPLTFGGLSVVGRAVYVATGTGPPPGPLTLAGPDTSRNDSPGSIIAFGDTSRSGARSPSTAPADSMPAAPPRRAAIRLSVSPHRARARRRVTFRFLTVRGSEPLAGVAIRLAGRVTHTDRRGRAAMSLRLRRPGVLAVRATWHGLTSARAKVDVTRGARR